MIDFAELIKKEVDPVAFWSLEIEDFKAKFSGNGWSKAGLCPFHADKKAGSFFVSNKGGFNCFVCGEKGDMIEFVIKQSGCSFVEACKKIIHDFSITLPQQTSTSYIAPAIGDEIQKSYLNSLSKKISVLAFIVNQPFLNNRHDHEVYQSALAYMIKHSAITDDVTHIIRLLSKIYGAASGRFFNKNAFQNALVRFDVLFHSMTIGRDFTGGYYENSDDNIFIMPAVINSEIEMKTAQYLGFCLGAAL